MALNPRRDSKMFRIKSEGRERTDEFEEDILSFKVKEQDPDYVVCNFYIDILPIIFY